MAAVINPLPNAGGGVDPETVASLEGVGMPIFRDQGGIASLCGDKKPQQMVA